MNYLLASAGELHTPLGHVLDKELLDVGIIGTISMQMVTMLLGVVLLLIFLLDHLQVAHFVVDRDYPIDQILFDAVEVLGGV